MRRGRIWSLAHRRKKTECGWPFSTRLFHAANTDVEGNTPWHRSEAHHFVEEFAGAMPRRRSRVLKRDFQVIPERVLAVTAKAHALSRNVDGHGLFKPGNPFRMHADGNRECPPHTSAPFGLVTIGTSVRGRLGLLYEMKSDRECRRGIGDAEGAGELIQFRRAFLLRRVFRRNFLACVGGANDFKYFVAPCDARENLRLAIGKRGVIGKSDPHRYPRRVG